MSVVFLCYTEDTGTGGNLSTAFSIPMLDQFMYMFGWELVGIHPEGADYPPRISKIFPTLSKARDEYPHHSWVFLDPTATFFLDQYSHPKDDVVYAVGHDLTGFGDEPLEGTSVRLRVKPEPFEGHAVPCLIAAACHRWARL